MRLLTENRFKIHPTKYPMLFLVGGCTVFNSFWAGVQKLTHGKKIAAQELSSPPIFVIGHWRSGTTLMHEILTQDKRLAFPSTYDCFLPHHFLVSRWFFHPVVKLLMPAHRPMDNMPAGVDLPQEDEFALCTMGSPTPYRRVAFCNNQPRHQDLLNTSSANPQHVEQLKNSLTHFCRALTLRYQKPLVLKSPTHTGRIAQLAEWFPGARFIHISRHPYRIFSSTIRLWKALDQVQSYQKPSYSEDWLRQFVFQSYEKMYQGYFDAADTIKDNRLIEIRYEDLMEDSLGTIGRIYSQLELPAFEETSSSVAQFLESRGNYKPNQLKTDPELISEINQRWSRYFERYGYDKQESSMENQADHPAPSST